MEKEFTPEQQEALRFDRHIALTANAGSGKTSVLQQRYVNILMDDENNPEPRNVVAITFTKEAAAEILAKVSKNIENRIGKETHLPKKIRLSKIRDKLNNAPISTIHSFCSTILRNFPIETNLPPNFDELTEFEKKEIYSNSIVQAMEEWLEEDSIEKKERIRNLIFTLGRKNVEEGIRFILNKRERFEQIKKYYTDNDEDSFILKRNELIIKELNDNYILTFDKIIEFIDLLNSKNSDKFSTLLTIKKELEKLTIDLGRDLSFDVESIINELNGIIKILFDEKIINKSFGLYLTIVKKFIDEDEIKYYNNYLSNIEYLEQICSSFQYHKNDKELFNLAKQLIEISSDVNDIIDDEKNILSAIDFDDQLIKTSELLNNEVVIEKIRRKIRFLMIDEFQDTNELQYNIIRKLIPELSGKKINGNVNFYAVGDEKQSIYGFRNADVRVFEKAKKDIEETNRTEYNNNNGNLNLTVTFRLAPIPAAFVNKVCSKLFENIESEYDVSYSQLVCNKGIPDMIEKENIKNIIDLSDKNHGNVCFLITDFKNEENEQSSEAKSLALYIKNDAMENEKKWSDYGILGRSRIGFDELISAFQEQGIPYILHSGKGFYKSMEVVDICSILSFLHNHNDNKAFASALRSPFFKITDEILFSISNVKNESVFWKKFNRFCELINDKNNNGVNISPDEINCLRALNILTELNYRAVRISIPQLIHKIIDLCSWFSVISGISSENQMKANINKLIQIARDFEKKGFKNLYDFVEQVKGTISSDLTESEAVFLSDENAVNIMTIHSSKGLEFDTVCLYASDVSYQHHPPFLINDELGLTFKMKIKDGNSEINKDVVTPAYLLASENQKRAESAESKRLLYVALTRAESNLIISGSINKKRQTGFQKSNLNMILKTLDSNLEFNSDIKEMSIIDTLKCFYKNEFYNLNIKYPVKFIYNYSEKSNHASNVKLNNKSEPIYLMDEIKSNIDNEVFSATKMMTFQNNFNEYARRYLFGLPSEDDEYYNSINTSDKTGEDDLIGSLAGTLIHSVLERIKDWLNSDSTVNEKLLKEIIDNIIENSNKNISDKLRERILNECITVANTTLIKLYAQYIKDSIAEQTLQIVYKNGLLLVKTDLFIKNASGEWEIWDWKTNRIDSEKTRNSLVKYYELQMKIYTYFLMKLYPAQNEFKARLMFTRLAKDEKLKMNLLQGKSESIDEWIYTYNWKREDFDKIENEIIQIIDRIRKEQI